MLRRWGRFVHNHRWLTLLMATAVLALSAGLMIRGGQLKDPRSLNLEEVLLIKSLGIGMAIAVAIDATLVRALIVPATMRLLGELNWWAPGPVARLYRRLGLGETSSRIPGPDPTS